MRRITTVQAALAVTVAALALAVAPGASAASTDLVNEVQTLTGGTLPSDTSSLQNLANQLASSGLVTDTNPDSLYDKLQALSQNYTGADAQTVSEILSAGLTAAQIDALHLTSTNSQYEDALATLAGSLSSDSAPTGAQLKPLTDAMRTLSGPADATGLLTSLADQIDALGGGVVPPELLDQLTAVLRLVGSTVTDCTTNPPGPNCPLANVLKALIPAATKASTGTSTPVTPPATAPIVLPAATPFTLTLKVSKIKIARNRKTAAVTVRSSAPAALLPVGFALTIGKKAAAKPLLFNLPTGQNVTKKVKLTSAAAKTLKKKGGTLKATPAFNVPGLTSVPSLTVNQIAKSAKVRKPRTRKR
jgi:hypothetical protein